MFEGIRVTRPIVFAEAVTFDPEVVVLILAAVTAAALAAAAVVVVGVVAGYRSGRYPERTRARDTWVACLVIEAVVAIPILTSRHPVAIAGALVALAATVAARLLGSRLADGAPALDQPDQVEPS